MKPSCSIVSVFSALFTAAWLASCAGSVVPSATLRPTPRDTTAAQRPVQDSAAPVIRSDEGLHTPPIAAPAPSADSLWDTTAADTAGELQEQQFQDGLKAFFSTDTSVIDTQEIGSYSLKTGSFDYRIMTDTVRIVINDSTKNRFFILPRIGGLCSSFGPRKSFWHFGTDIRLKTGDTVRCAMDGIVRVSLYDRYGYGKVVIVRHADGLETLYGHLSKSLVKPRQHLKAGEVIGRGGNTGHSFGPHLHFEIRYRSEAIDAGSVANFETGQRLRDTIVLTRQTFSYLDELRKTVYYTVRKGDNLGKIARAYGTTVRKLCILNGVTGRTILRVGRKIIIRKDNNPDAERKPAPACSITKPKDSIVKGLSSPAETAPKDSVARTN
jgi:murein DD-endopeptidase MepM/ murein hydrolase activator NlpD